MNPITHFLASWSLATSCNLSGKERAMVAISGITPDIDGLGIVVDFLGPRREQQIDLWSKYHHILGHNIGFGLALAAAAFALSTKRRTMGLLVLGTFHLHLFCDLAGARGPDGYQWPIPYLLPFSDAWQWAWSGQWQLNAWPNFIFTGVLLCHMFYLAWKRQTSPMEIVSPKANAALATTLRQRFGMPKQKQEDPPSGSNSQPEN